MKSLALAVALAFSTSALAATPPAAPVKLPAKPGVVSFDHKPHGKLKCAQCHKDAKGGPIEGFGKTLNKDKAHGVCHECHKKEGTGPQKCADCHKK